MQTEQPRQPEQLFAPSPDTATPNRTALAVQCAYTPDGKLQRKTERLNGNADEYAYTFDRQGRLLETRLNGKLLEAYRYNSSGQRILHTCGHDGLREFERQFRYDSAGRLAQAGRAKFYYDRSGALGQRCDDNGTTFFEYSHDGARLEKASRPDGWEIRYRYGVFNGQPSRRLKNGNVTHEYRWLDGTRLDKCLDHASKLEYRFFYDAAGKLDRLRLSVMPERNLDIWAQFRPDRSIIEEILGPIGTPADSGQRRTPNAWKNSGRSAYAGGNPYQIDYLAKDPYGLFENCTFNDAGAASIEECTWGDSRPNTFMDQLCEDMERNDRRYIRAWFDDNLTPLEFLCCTDQVGTLRALVAPNGAVIKEIRRDSFGVPYHDSFPNFALPIGFAGGLEDPDTGLVRFGWRDYDPTIGRFTSLDPAKDRRGDGDLYDYCQDDPVSRVDPTGLWSKENFDESKVSRDHLGQFASTGGSGNVPGSGSSASSGELYAAAPTGTATDAGGTGRQEGKEDFPADVYKEHRGSRNILTYSSDPKLPSKLAQYQAKISLAVLEQGEDDILTEHNAPTVDRAILAISSRLQTVTSASEELRLRAQLALLVLGEYTYTRYVANMTILASGADKNAKQKAREDILRLREPSGHYSPEFIEQQSKMANRWFDILSDDKVRSEFTGLVADVRNARSPEAKKAAMERFLYRAAEASGMPATGVSIGGTSDPEAIAATTGDGRIIFNEKKIFTFGVDELMHHLFHEAGHAWKNTLKEEDIDNLSQQDKSAFKRRAFHDPHHADFSLYEGSPDEAHAHIFENAFRRRHKQNMFSARWGELK